MYKEIKIGEKVVPMLSNGATPIRYRQLFHKDLLNSFTSDGNKVTLVAEDVPELAYILAMSAEKKDMSTLNMESYIEWLEQFEAMDILMSSEQIYAVYFGNMMTTSEPKKKDSVEPSDN